MRVKLLTAWRRDTWATQLEDVRRRAAYACHFSAANGSVDLGTVPATWHSLPEGVVRCTAPAVPSAAASGRTIEADVAISVNGADFSPSAARFDYLVPPNLTDIEPSSGPSRGATDLTVFGHGFSSHLGLECTFEDANVPATIVDDNSLRCASPSLGHAAPNRHHGVAYSVDEVPLGGGAERLFTAVRLSNISGAEAAVAGHVLVPIPAGTPPLTDFHMAWMMMLPEEGEGLASETTDARTAFRYGPLPADGFGGEGALEGLSVSLSDGPAPLAVEVRLDGYTLLSRALGAPLPRGLWMRVKVDCTDGVLGVAIDDADGERRLVSDLQLPSWLPQRSWAMGIGASGARPGRYLMEPRLTSALILGLESVRVKLRLLGQQHAGPELDYLYTAEAVVSEISPASGPAAAPTPITIRGANFDLGLAVKCRLEQGATVVVEPATLLTNGSDAEINCTLATAPWASGDVDVYVGLGDIDAHGPGGTFQRYATPVLTKLSPLIGVGDSTHVTVEGEGLGIGLTSWFDGTEG